MWEAMNKGGTGLAVGKKKKKNFAKIRNCSQEGGGRNEMGNMGGDGN